MCVMCTNVSLCPAIVNGQRHGQRHGQRPASFRLSGSWTLRDRALHGSAEGGLELRELLAARHQVLQLVGLDLALCRGSESAAAVAQDLPLPSSPGRELWRSHRFKVTRAQLFDALKHLKFLVEQQAQYA